MKTERSVMELISNLPNKKICIIGSMQEKFYEMLSESITKNDYIYIFDINKNIKKIEAIINKNNYEKINIISFSATDKKFDWYGWHLLQYYYKIHKMKKSTQVFAAIFYHGKHLFQYDMGPLLLAMKMILDGGFLTVYNCSWSLANSPTMKPEVNNKTAMYYTKEQISISHMQYLLDAYIDEKFIEQEQLSSVKTRVYRKKINNFI